MNYQRIYLLSFIGMGAILSSLVLPTLLTDPSVFGIMIAISGGGMAVSGGYELFVSDAPFAPSEPNLQFFAVVLGFVLSAAGIAVHWIV